MFTAVADTHALLWYIDSDVRLSAIAKQAMDTAYHVGDQIAISSITLVEMVYLIEKGRIRVEVFSRVARGLAEPDSLFVEIPVDLAIARALSKVNVTQIPDMPDRIIAATAVHLNVPLISRDGKIQVSGINTIW
jgi:PIN domain nuclease of toxin-antitoxin system